MASRREGGRRGKLMGHAVEARVRNYLVSATSADRALTFLRANGVQFRPDATIGVAVIGSLSVGALGGGVLTTPKTDILLHQSAASGGSEMRVGVSIKSSTLTKAGVLDSEGQAWDVPHQSLVALLGNLATNEVEVIERFAQGAYRRDTGGAPDDVRGLLVTALRTRIELLTDLVFARGTAMHRLFWATHLWFAPREKLDSNPGELFAIDDLRRRAREHSDLISWAPGESSLLLPWGKMQKTRSSNTSVQFRHDLTKIRALFER